MNWTLILIILTGVFAVLAATRQYVENNTIPIHETGWKRFKKRYLRSTLIFTFLATICAATASVVQFIDNEKVSKRNDELQAQLINYVFGSNEVPAFTISIVGKKAILTISNPDKNYPIYNVKVKCRETFYPDVGTLYPKASKIIDVADTSKFNDGQYYFIIWYNNVKNFETDVEFRRNLQGDLIVTTKYLNADEIEFIPPWQKRADSLNKFKPIGIQHYHPNQHF